MAAGDVFLYQGEPNPNDVKLTDPTVLSGGSVNATAFPAGVAAITAIGLVIAMGAANVSAIGVSTGSAIGSPIVHGAAKVIVSGVATTSAIGAPVTRGAAGATPLGVVSAAAVGQPVSHGDARVNALGRALVTALGTVTATGGGADAIATPAGLALVAAIGQVTAFDASVPVIVNGGAGRRRHGERLVVPFSQPARVHAVGVAATAAIGEATASGVALARPFGIDMWSAIGQVQANGIQNIEDDVWLLLFEEAA